MDTVTCKACGREFDTDALLCPFCGAHAEPLSDLYGDEYIQLQIQKTEQEYTQEGSGYRWIALIFAAVGVLFFLLSSGNLLVLILFFAIAAVIFGTSYVHGSTTERFFEAGHLADGRSCCPRCGGTEVLDMPVPMAKPVSNKKTRFGTSPAEQYYKLSRNKYFVCRKCGTQFFVNG